MNNATTSILEIRKYLKEFTEIWNIEVKKHDYSNHNRLDELAKMLFNYDKKNPQVATKLTSSEATYLEYAKILAHSKNK